MARLLHWCLLTLQIRQWYWTWKAFLSVKNYFYQHQNITIIIIMGECETCLISEITIIILSLTFISSFEAATFSFMNLFSPPSRFSLLYTGCSLCCLPHFAPTDSRKKRAAERILFTLSAMRNTKGWLKVVCKAGKFFQCCFLETIFSPEGGILKSYKSKGICSITLKLDNS